MSFRSKLLLAIIPVVLTPLAVLAYGVRTALNDRFQSQVRERLDATVDAIQAEVESLSADLQTRTQAIQSTAASDNRFRLAARAVESERQYLLDYASYAMTLSGLSILQIQDAQGRVLSSGHFRNQYDQELPLLARELVRVPHRAVVASFVTSDAVVDALIRADSFRLGDQWLHMTAGMSLPDRVESWSRTSDPISLTLRIPGDSATTNFPTAAAASDDAISDVFRIPYLGESGRADHDVSITIAHSMEPLRALQRQVDRWSILVFAVAAAATLAVITLVAARVSQPLVTLANQTASLDLDRLDAEFASDRKDEIGSLTRLLASMVARLRTSTSRLREAERRAAVGDLARQVNHDIKNGLVPIRNVIHHLTEVQRDEPDQLAIVFNERRATIDSSIAYLEKLASHYARLTPDRLGAPTVLNDVVREVVSSLVVPENCTVRLDLDDAAPPIDGDRLSVRRIIENLAGNAVDSLEGTDGVVTVATQVTQSSPGIAVLSVSDTGCGMSQDQLDRAFEDFQTTKPGGTGLGLSVVKRLVGDLGGSLRIQTAPDQGTAVVVEFRIASRSGSVE